MRKGGWQLPYHPLQVVAIAVFLALGFAFYVFFVPFVGGDVLQYVLLGLCTPLITSVVVLFVWCAATDPGDPGIFKLKRHLRMPSNSKHEYPEEKSLSDGCCAVNDIEKLSNIFEGKDSSSHPAFSRVLCLICTPFSCLCKRCFHSDDQSLEQHASEEGMFVCSLCEAEVLQHSKHCRVCDKCVDGFDHHCGLIMQLLVGALVLILCFMKQGEFSGQIVSKLGSSFSTAAFVVVVVACSLQAMIATIPLSQLLLFHILLIKKYVSHPDMPHNSDGKKTKEDEGTKRKTPGPIKISPWTLARLNAEEVSKAAAEAKKKSKVLQPITRREVPKPDKRRPDRSRVFLPEQSPDVRAMTSASGTDSNFSNMAMEPSASLAPLQHEARSAFQPSVASSIRNLNIASSPESSLDSPDHPFRVSLSGADELRSFMSLAASESTAQKSIALSRSTSGGYEASGGEDNDRIPSRIVHRSSNWTNLILNSGRRETASDLSMPTSGGFITNTRLT